MIFNIKSWERKHRNKTWIKTIILWSRFDQEEEESDPRQQSDINDNNKSINDINHNNEIIDDDNEIIINDNEIIKNPRRTMRTEKAFNLTPSFLIRNYRIHGGLRSRTFPVLICTRIFFLAKASHKLLEGYMEDPDSWLNKGPSFPFHFSSYAMDTSLITPATAIF